MVKKIIISIFCLFLPIFVSADELTLNGDAPKTYLVKKGDTLWDISAIFLKQPWLWPKLWRMNPEINNPHLIYPGDTLSLVYDQQGQPMLVKGKTELKWSPKIRTSLKDLTAVSTLALNVIAPYIKYEHIFNPEQIDELPYVLGSDEGYKSSLEHFKLYIKGDLQLGHSYAIYEKGDPVIDPETELTIGYYAKLAGTGKAIRAGDITNKIPATLLVESSNREIRSGYLVLPVNENQMLPAFYQMQAAHDSVRGKIIKVSSGVREFGKLEVVMINQGRADKLMQGDVLSIKRKSASVVETEDGPVYATDTSRWNRLATAEDSDYQMPEENIGKMMVFKVYDKVSMALVLRTQKSLRLQDIVTAP
jgi:hypothetical protein